MDAISPLFPDYYVSGSNWKIRDAWESGLLGDEYYTEMYDNFILGLREGQFDRYLDNPAEYQMQRY